MGQVVNRRRNLAGEVVVRQIETVEAEERRDSRRELAGKLVVREKEKFQGGEVRETWKFAGETVSLEAENSELSERG